MKLNGSVTYQNIVGLSRFICRKTAIITWFTQQKYLCFSQKQCDKTVCCISWWEVLHISSTARGEPWTSSPVVPLGWQVVVRFTFFFLVKFTFCCHKNQSSKGGGKQTLCIWLCSQYCVCWEWEMRKEHGWVCLCVYLYYFQSCR